MSSAYMETHEMDTSLDETILMDANKMKKTGNHSYFRIGSSEVSPNHELLAWTQDTEGSEKYSLHVKGISNDTEMISPVKNTYGRGLGWAADSMTLFYTTLDMFGRPSAVQRRNIFTSDDETVFKTPSPGMFPIVRAEDNAIYISLAGEQDLPVLQLFVLSDRPGNDFQPILPPKRGMNYAAKLSNGYFYIQLSGEDQPNGKVIAAPMDAPQDMKVLLPESSSSLLERMSMKDGYVAMSERDNGLTTIKAYRIPKDGSSPTPFNRDEPLRRLTFDEPTYTLRGVPGPGPESPVSRVLYTSLATPKQIIDFNLETGNRVIKDSEEVPEFKREDYKSERIWATSADETEVPVSLVYREELLQTDGSNPLLLEGYGGSGLVAEAAFDTKRPSILDRGIIYAIAHVRGSRYLGERWFQDGKLLNKRNTFMDFIAVADHLIKHSYTIPEQLVIQGASAGGILVLAVLNERPELFAAGIAEVPPTDLISLFSDDSESIAVLLRSEYGNPKENETVYDYMLTYSPYDNIRSDTPYPHLYVRGGAEDSRVPFWEPVKYVAKLRQAQADRLKETGPSCNYLNRLLLLDMNMDTGHVRPGRDFANQRFATNLAFMLKSVGTQKEAILGSAGNGTSIYD